MGLSGRQFTKEFKLAAVRRLEQGVRSPKRRTPVAVISYDYWRRRFALNPAAIGKSLTYATATLTIVGVEPPGFEGIDRSRTCDFAVPLSMSEQLGGGNGEC